MKGDSSLYTAVLTSSAAIAEQIVFGNLMDMVKLEKQRNFSKSYLASSNWLLVASS